MDHIAKLIAKRDNARGLAEISRRTSADYAAKGIAVMAKHHAMKAADWASLADCLDEQIAYEAAA